MKEQAAKNIQQINAIRTALNNNLITYKQAKLEAQPIIDKINEKNLEIAKKYKMKPSKINFTGLMR